MNTPLTDAFHEKILANNSDSLVEDLLEYNEFAKKLEAENAALRAELGKLQESVARWSASLPENFHWDWLRDEMNESIQARAALAKEDKS
jgi:hypothetical protein